MIFKKLARWDYLITSAERSRVLETFLVSFFLFVLFLQLERSAPCPSFSSAERSRLGENFLAGSEKSTAIIKMIHSSYLSHVIIKHMLIWALPSWGGVGGRNPHPNSLITLLYCPLQSKLHLVSPRKEEQSLPHLPAKSHNKKGSLDI